MGRMADPDEIAKAALSWHPTALASSPALNCSSMLAAGRSDCNSDNSSALSDARPVATRSEHSRASRPCSHVALEERSELICSRRQFPAAATDKVKFDAYHGIDQLTHHLIKKAALSLSK